MKGFKIKKQVFCLRNVSEEVLNLVRDVARNKNIGIHQLIDKDINVFADVDHVKLVFRNLVNNAVKFSNPGGRITLDAIIEDNSCKISITDTGIGIDASLLDDFFTGKSVESQFGTLGEKGTGLGLIVCKEFVERNGGNIWVESKVGEGSTFYFTLPLTK